MLLIWISPQWRGRPSGLLSRFELQVAVEGKHKGGEYPLLENSHSFVFAEVDLFDGLKERFSLILARLTRDSSVEMTEHVLTDVYSTSEVHWCQDT